MSVTVSFITTFFCLIIAYPVAYILARSGWKHTYVLLMLFIMLNQIFQSELGFIPLRDRANFFGIDYKNTSYIWGPGTDDAIGNFLALFTPGIFKTVPVGEFAGQTKYWPWFWMIVPCYVLVTPLSVLLALIFDHKSLKEDMKKLFKKKVKA